MKKIYLLFLAGAVANMAHAQNLRMQPERFKAAERQSSASTLSTDVEKQFPGPGTPAAKTTGTVLFSETFGSGTPTSLPTGWTAQNLNGTQASWKWAKARTTGNYSIAAILSTSAADGWMVYDSDSIGKLTPSIVPFGGTLTSPVYNLSTQPAVEISFQQFFKRFQDTCFLEVTNNNFSTFTTYPILPNNTRQSNESLDNPTSTRINVSSVAGNQASVRFRFRYSSAYAGGSYNWIIDDVKVSAADPVDVASASAFHLMTLRDGNVTTFGDLPTSLLDSVYLYGNISNYGNSAQTNTAVNFAATNGNTGSTVFTQSASVASMPINSYGNLVRSNPFIPSAQGLYYASAGTNVSGDANTGNNTDSTFFRVTDSTLSASVFNWSSGYYIARPADAANPNGLYFTQGILFDIPYGKTDTLTGFSVSFHPVTAPSTFGNGKLSVQLYTFDTASGNFDPIVSSIERVPTTAEISTSGTSGQTRFSYFPLNRTGVQLSTLILKGGSYAAVVQCNGMPTNASAVVASTFSMAPRSYFIPGISKTSTNDGAFSLTGTTFTSNDLVPLVRAHFGRTSTPNAVSNVSAAVAGAAFPNPANTVLTVPVTASAAAEVTVTLSTPTGQIVASQNLGRMVAGQQANATFNTAAVASGLYFYTVEAAGQRSTQRVVVSH